MTWSVFCARCMVYAYFVAILLFYFLDWFECTLNYLLLISRGLHSITVSFGIILYLGWHNETIFDERYAFAFQNRFYCPHAKQSLFEYSPSWSKFRHNYSSLIQTYQVTNIDSKRNKQYFFNSFQQNSFHFRFIVFSFNSFIHRLLCQCNWNGPFSLQMNIKSGN